MNGRHPWSEIAKKFSPEQRREIDAIKRELEAKHPPVSASSDAS